MPGNTSENPILAQLAEKGRNLRMSADQVDGIKQMADILQTHYGVDFSNSDSVKAAIGKMQDILKSLSTEANYRPGVAQTVNQDQNATMNIANILSGVPSSYGDLFSSPSNAADYQPDRSK